MKTLELDLHGVRHRDVRRNMDMFLGDALLSGVSQAFIITGNSSDMKMKVHEVLAEYQLTGETDPKNYGMMIVHLS
jgi:DNA-nicking Smr family endonuclease